MWHDRGFFKVDSIFCIIIFLFNLFFFSTGSESIFVFPLRKYELLLDDIYEEHITIIACCKYLWWLYSLAINNWNVFVFNKQILLDEMFDTRYSENITSINYWLGTTYEKIIVAIKWKKKSKSHKIIFYTILIIIIIIIILFIHHNIPNK